MDDGLRKRVSQELSCAKAGEGRSDGDASGRRDEMTRPSNEVHHQYSVERELAARLRAATKEERLRLYRQVYDERISRIPSHPLLVRSLDPAATQAANARKLRLLRPFLGPGTRFLELGAGDGSLARAVAPYVEKVYAVDVSLALVPRTAWPDNLEWLLIDGVSLPLQPGSIDFAYSDQVLEHVHPEDAAEQTRNVCDALRPGGSYLCVTPHPFSGPWDVSRFFDDVATGLHLKEYTFQELVALLASAGFERVHALVSLHGRHLSPAVHPGPFIALEQVVGHLPRTWRKSVARGLAAVKMIGTKGPGAPSRSGAI